MCLDVPGSYYHLIQMGARMHLVEVLAMYVIPVFFYISTYQEWFLWNTMCQLILFIPVVIIPCCITGHMFYVDIGWPTGLWVMAVNGMVLGTGWSWRKYLIGGCMFLHGLRMSLGAIVMFFPYKREQDLPRYAYAKVRFLTKDGMPENLWCIKVQHDMLQQAYANAVPLALPVMLAVFNPTESFHWGEIVGVLLWVACWLWENVADVQKVKFLAATKGSATKDEVLGYTPFDGPEYRLWTLCRHPNYFGEWMSWVAFTIMGIPSLIASSDELYIKIGFGVTLWLMIRFFYDCLNFWTGAEPAEHFSVQKRAAYKEYQKQTRVFFPVEVPCVDHCRIAGWPNPEGLQTEMVANGA